MQKVLVTGGAGFIGSFFVQLLLEGENPPKVITIDKLTYAGSRKRLDSILNHPRHEFVHGDIQDMALVDRLMQRVDTVVNFAAETHVDRSIASPTHFILSNV